MLRFLLQSEGKHLSSCHKPLQGLWEWSWAWSTQWVNPSLHSPLWTLTHPDLHTWAAHLPPGMLFSSFYQTVCSATICGGKKFSKSKSTTTWAWLNATIAQDSLFAYTKYMGTIVPSLTLKYGRMLWPLMLTNFSVFLKASYGTLGWKGHAGKMFFSIRSKISQHKYKHRHQRGLIMPTGRKQKYFYAQTRQQVVI